MLVEATSEQEANEKAQAADTESDLWTLDEIETEIETVEAS